jgi:hypothetical protein
MRTVDHAGNAEGRQARAMAGDLGQVCAAFQAAQRARGGRHDRFGAFER